MERGTFQVVDWPISKPVIPLKWVFTYKFDENGNLNKYKGRICVRGDLQPVSHEENRAATLALRVFRMLMALVAAFDLETDQLDAINAFLNSPLDEEVYVRIPDGFKQPEKVWLLNQALYGLRKAPHLWQEEFTQTLHSIDL